MLSLIEIQKEADKLSTEEKAGLVAHLLASFPPSELEGDDDGEADRRDLEVDNGEVTLISYEQFRHEVGRG